MTIFECVEEIKKIQKSNISKKAIFVDGDWGIGKTYGIKKEFNDAIYVSLYGVKNEEELYSRFNKEVYDSTFLENENKKKFIKAGKEILYETSKIKPNKSIINAIPIINMFSAGIDILSVLAKMYISNMDISEKIIIIDDLERIEIRLNVVEGFIDYVINKRKAKVIIIGNEKRINKEENDKDEIKKLKDKICDFCFKVKDIDTKLICEILSINEEKEKNILDYIEKNQINNLRIFEKVKFLYNFFVLKLDKSVLKYKNKNILKLIILDVIKEEISIKKEKEKGKGKVGEQQIISELIEMHSKEFTSFISGEYYISDNILKNLSYEIRNIIVDGNEGSIKNVNNILKQLLKEFNEKPYRHMSNKEIKAYINRGIESKIEDVANLYEYLKIIDRTIDYYNMCGIKIDKRIVQNYCKNVEEKSSEIINYLLSFKQKSLYTIQGTFALLNNKELLKKQFIGIIFKKLENEIIKCVNIVNISDNYYEIQENIVKISNLINFFEVDCSKYKSLKKINFDIKDMVYNIDLENVLRRKFELLYKYDNKYVSKKVKEIKKYKFKNTSAKIIYKDIVLTYEKYEKEKEKRSNR